MAEKIQQGKPYYQRRIFCNTLDYVFDESLMAVSPLYLFPVTLAHCSSALSRTNQLRLYLSEPDGQGSAAADNLGEQSNAISFGIFFFTAFAIGLAATLNVLPQAFTRKKLTMIPEELISDTDREQHELFVKADSSNAVESLLDAPGASNSVAAPILMAVAQSIAILYAGNCLVESLFPFIGLEPAEKLAEEIEKHSCLPERGETLHHFYLDDGYFYRGQKTGIDDIIKNGYIGEDEPGVVYVSKNFEDTVRYSGMDESAGNQWAIFIYPSSYFNEAINRNAASSGIKWAQSNARIATYPYFRGTLPITPAGFLIVDKIKMQEYEVILKLKSADAKGLRSQLLNLTANGLRIISLLYSGGPYFDPDFQYDMEDFIAELDIPQANRFLTHNHNYNKDLERIIRWILYMPNMSGIFVGLALNIEELSVMADSVRGGGKKGGDDK
jgi:hypothetical protein